jgi:predicted nucleic acid-binding protein
MTRAYVDSSCLVGLAFGEAGASRLRKRLLGFDRLLSSNLLEAEVRAALRREGVPGGDDLLTWIDWVMPSRPLTEEIRWVLAGGYQRGGDLWHLATALYLAPDPGELPFLTLDKRQAEVARQLGFPS